MWRSAIVVVVEGGEGNDGVNGCLFVCFWKYYGQSGSTFTKLPSSVQGSMISKTSDIQQMERPKTKSVPCR
jgi:hypothetical protein